MTGTGGLEEAGERIEALLEELGRLPDRRARQWAEELLRTVIDVYGTGLERVVDIVRREPGLLERLAADEVVSSLLVVHDLHPEGLRARIEGALDDIRPSLGEGDVRLLELDDEAGRAKIRLLVGPGPGAGGVEGRVRRAVAAAAPEIAELEVDRPTPLSPPAGATPVRLRRAQTVEAGA